MDIVVDNPNFSVVVPSGCDASCDFCFWEEKESLSKSKFLDRLQEVVDLLPYQFYQVSVTGGEPTLCRWVKDILTILRDRFETMIRAIRLSTYRIVGKGHRVKVPRTKAEEGDIVGIFNVDNGENTDIR